MTTEKQTVAFERIQYNRQLHFNGRVIVVAVASDPNSQITITSSQEGHGATGIGVSGAQGADLIVAMSSVLTAALQEADATAKVGMAKISSIKVDGEWQIQFSNAATAFVLDIRLMQDVLRITQIVLNDAVGEYRRQLSQIELDRANFQHQAAESAALIEQQRQQQETVDIETVPADQKSPSLEVDLPSKNGVAVDEYTPIIQPLNEVDEDYELVRAVVTPGVDECDDIEERPARRDMKSKG